MTKDAMKEFINREYKKITVGQFFQVSLSLWLLCGLTCFFGKDSRAVIVCFCLLTLIATAVLLILLVKYKNIKMTRFLYDTIFFVYLSVFFIYIAYKLIVQNTGEKPLLILLFSVLYILVTFFSALIFTHLLSSGKLNGKKSGKLVLPPVVGAVLGVVSAKLLFSSISQSVAVSIGIGSCLFLSFAMSIGLAVCLLKIVFFKKLYGTFFVVNKD